ncbi:NUDIX hydrolase [Listeria cossartiae]|uniref:NUDIX hydrolase n=1 Tax=Listeria cossartiae TaxID=2838249 RepID=UPI0028808B37|nr:NUDIX pyrophosphatase [Listeria cossartiae]MDT0015120.1 NUDIX pyrophosphatase [Listeria cossartiae subsp. cayugensis]
MRQPFQVLVMPFIKKAADYQYGVLLRNDEDVWQFVAGGGEAAESHAEAAIRESMEELNVGDTFNMYQLDSLAHIPSFHFAFDKPYVIPEYCFAIDLTSLSSEVELSLEHKALQWLSYEEASGILEWDSNKTALYELNERLKNNDMKAIKKG